MAALNACTSRAGEDIGEGEGGGYRYLRGLLHPTSMITNFETCCSRCEDQREKKTR